MHRLGGERGFSLMEVLIALGILGMIGTAFMIGLGTGTRASGTLDEQAQAAALARSQLSDIMNVTYDECVPPNPCYTLTVTPPPQYSVSIQATDLNGNSLVSGNTIQRLTVSVSRPGKPVLSLTTYRKK